MRRITKIIGLMSMAALLAFSASSCKKTDEKSSFQISLSQAKGYDSGERAYLDINDDCKFKWSEDDQIMVYNLAEDYTESVAEVFTADPGAEGQATTTFSGTSVGGRKDIGYFYFYPAYKAQASKTNELQADNRETFTVEDYQLYDENHIFDPTSLVMACDVNSLSDNFTMQHIFGFLNLRVRTEGLGAGVTRNVESIVVEDKAFNLSGSMSLKLPAVNSDKFTELYNECISNNPNYAADLAEYFSPQYLGYESLGGTKFMTLDCSEAYNGQGVQLGAARRPFFLTLRPGALYKGFKVTVNFVEDVEPFEVEFPANIANCIQPAWFKNIDIVVNR